MNKDFLKYLSVRGNKTALAKELGITKGAVSQWTVIPITRVADIEQITGISRHDLRPDIFGASQ